jgi:hypothetical protein
MWALKGNISTSGGSHLGRVTVGKLFLTQARTSETERLLPPDYFSNAFDGPYYWHSIPLAITGGEIGIHHVSFSPVYTPQILHPCSPLGIPSYFG